MKINKKLLLIGGIALVVFIGLVLGGLALLGVFGGNEPDGEPVAGDPTTYAIEVQSASGIALADVGIYIYQNSDLQELTTFIKTDAEGKASFTDLARDTYVAVLDNVPTGYVAEPYYPISGELTKIVLETGKMEDANLDELVYKLGDAMLDFSVTAPDGTVYTLSGLLEGKKAVVLNFFYNECQPCMNEFPFLQEAYEQYKDQIAVLAMNPVNTDNEALAKLQKELAVTFPMVLCGSEWEKIMQITAYPTTVIIDRYGVICLIHTGSVPDAKTFTDAFAYFCAEDYEQKLIDSIEDLKAEEEKGTEENPNEVGGESSFEVTVEPGQVVYFDLYKVTNMYLQIRNKNAYVIYNDKTYYPEGGVVGLIVSCPDTFTPAKIGIGNSGTKTETFKVTLSVLAGTFNNPYTMELGEFDVKVSAGNSQGVYYLYTAKEDGTLTLECLSVTPNVEYGYYLYNLSTSAMRTLDADGVVDPSTGRTTVSVQAKKGQQIQVCISTLPDGSNTYPAAKFKFNATFNAGKVDDQEVIQTTDYTVTVKDNSGNPVSNVSVIVNVDEQTTQAFTTNTSGVANIKLPTGTYQGEIYVPEGYKASTTTFTLTETAPDVMLTLTKIKQLEYTVYVKGQEGEKLEGVLVKIGDNAWLRTDANGVVKSVLPEDSYTVTIMLPNGYTGETSYSFAAGATEMTITLGYPVGSEKNPAKVDSYPYETPALLKNTEYFCLFYYTDEVALTIQDEDAYIRWGTTTYKADENGVVRISLKQSGMSSPVLLAVGNGGTTREKYTVEPEFEVGTQKNPHVVEVYPFTTPELQTQQEYFCEFYFTKALQLQIADQDAYVRYGDKTYTADASGMVIIPVDADGIESPAQMVIGNASATSKTFTVELVQHPVGSEKNPCEVNTYPYETPVLESQQEIYFTFQYKVALSLQIADPNAYIRWNNTTYGADPEGFVIIPLDGVPAPVTMIIGNSGAEATSFTVELHIPDIGTEKNPYDVESYPYTTPDLEGQQEVYFNFFHERAKKLLIRDANAYVRFGQTVYEADASGVVTVPMDDVVSPTVLIIGNKAQDTKQFTVELEQYPIGSQKYPEAITQIGKLPALTLEEGNSQGHYYTYTATEAGTFTVVVQNLPGVQYDIKLSIGSKTALLSQSDVEREVSIEMTANEKVTVNVYALADAQTGKCPAATFDLNTIFMPAATEDDAEYLYTVTITDVFGAAYKDVGVIFMQNGNPVTVTYTDASGVAELYAKLGSYTVELFFEGEQYYYDQATAVLTANNRRLTIRLVSNIDETDTTEIYILNGNSAYNLYVGGTRVQVSNSKPNFSAENGNNCFFTFTPTQAGTYQITASNSDVELSFWGSTFFINQQYTSKDSGKNGAITESISGTSVGNTTYVIGIKADSTVRDVVLNVARIGDPEFNISDQPWTEWQTGYTHSGTCNVTVSSTPTYLDIKAVSGTYNLYYDEAKGYYRLYEGGPVVLVNLGYNSNPNGTFIGLYERVNGNGQYGGAAITRYFYDSTGSFVKKENYTECLAEYFTCAGITNYSQTVYHPLTKELMYILQNGFVSWWDSSSPNYLEVFGTANKEYAWMFACCYVP